MVTILKIFGIIAVLYGALALILFIKQRSLIYFPDSNLPPPARAGVAEMEVVHLQTADKLELLSWYKQAEANQPTLIYFHGNAGNISYRAPIVKPFLEAGFGVLLVSYRGYGNNPGSPSEKGFYLDAAAALDFIQKQSIPISKIVLYGESIGCGVAMYLAAHHKVGAIILQAPFTSLGNMGQYHYPFFPVKWLLFDSFDLIQWAKKIQSPSLILLAERDEIVPNFMTKKVFEALPEPKILKIFPNTGHNDLFDPIPAIEFINKL